jgi:hypothetical protein
MTLMPGLVAATLGNDDLFVANENTGLTIPSASIAAQYEETAHGAIATFRFPGFAGGVLPDGNYRASIGPHAVTNPGGADNIGYAFEFFVLTADANHDRAVDSIDFNVIASNFGTSGKSFSQGDFNGDATVDTADFNILAANFGRTLAPFGDSAFSSAARSPTASILHDISRADDARLDGIL